MIHYKLNELILTGKIKEESIIKSEETLSIIKTPIRISDNEEVFGIKKTIKTKNLPETADFSSLNHAAKKSGLFPPDVFEKAEELRRLRNRIHPYALKEVDDKYTKEEINNVFSIASLIIERVQNY